jgi:multiple sugar transport system permease protein
MYSRAEKFGVVTKLVFYLLLLVWLIYALVPLYWVFTSAFKPKLETQISPPTLFPSRLTLRSFVDLFTNPIFSFRPYLNTLIISFGTVGVTLFFSSLGGYGFSRFRFPLRRWLLLSLILIRLLPTLILIIPFYRIFLKYGLYNTYAGLILIDGISATPFCTWLMFGFFESVPFELEEAALLDGCSFLRSLWHIVLPLAVPGMAAVAIFSFLGAWNDFTNAVVLTSSQAIRPYTVILYKMVSDRGVVKWDLLSAGSFIALIPVMVLFIVFQRYFLSGLTEGALKT